MVQNMGKTAGDEVVQLYVTNPSTKGRTPIRSLAGVQRINLKPAEKRMVKFMLTPRQMSVVLNDGGRVVEPGEIQISVGGKQPGFAGSADASTTSVVSGRFTIIGKPVELPK